MTAKLIKSGDSKKDSQIKLEDLKGFELDVASLEEKIQEEAEGRKINIDEFAADFSRKINELRKEFNDLEERVGLIEPAEDPDDKE